MGERPQVLRSDPVFSDPLQVHTDAGKAVLASGDLFAADLVVFGMLQRSLDLVLGVRTLIEERNFTCAVALARLQIDSLVRLAYMATLPDADEFALQVLSGKPLHRLKDAGGKALTDKRLREYAEQHFPWVEDLYEKASRFIHFSDEHIFTSAQLAPEEHLHLSITVSPERWSDELFEEFAEAFAYITKRLLGVIVDWGDHKVGLAARRVVQEGEVPPTSGS